MKEVIPNSEYIGRGNFVAKQGSNKWVERYDYFETEVTIDGEPWTVSFDVEVQHDANNYRTHRVIKEISLMQSNHVADRRPVRPAWNDTSSLSDESVSQEPKEVKSEAVEGEALFSVTETSVLQSSVKSTAPVTATDTARKSTGWSALKDNRIAKAMLQKPEEVVASIGDAVNIRYGMGVKM